MLAAMSSHKLTGVVRVKPARGPDLCAYLMDGDILAAESSDEASRLCRRLIRRGLLTDEEMSRLLETTKDPRRLGEHLVEGHIVSDDQLKECFTEQFQDILNGAILVVKGTYAVEILDAVFADNFQLDFSTHDLLSRGRKLREELGPILTALGDGELGLAPGSSSRTVPLSAEESRLVQLSDRDRRLEVILDRSPLDLVPTLRTVVKLLERKALALAPIQVPDESNPEGNNSSRRDKQAGIFLSQDSVLDKVDLSHVTHFSVATEIPLSGVVETLGLEDLDESEREEAQAMAGEMTTRPLSRQTDGDDPGGDAEMLTSEADDESMEGDDEDDESSGEVLRLEPGRIVEPSQDEPAVMAPSADNHPMAPPVSEPEVLHKDDIIFSEGDGDDELMEEGPIDHTVEDEKPNLPPAEPTSPALARRLSVVPSPAATSATPGGRQAISPLQRQSLQRRTATYNRIYRTIFTHFSKYTDERDVLKRFQAFFQPGTSKYPELFLDLSFQPDGTLDAEKIIRNLEMYPTRRPFEIFDLALHEILAFLHKEIPAFLPNAHDEGQLMLAIADLRQQLFRKGAQPPPLK